MNKIAVRKRREREPKMAKRRSKEIIYKGIKFDSQTECLFYQHLERDPTVKEIQIQPEYQIIEPYKVICKKCQGRGASTNPNTGNDIKCRRCKGIGRLTKPGAIYTADFRIEYIDGLVEVVDVKGYTGNQRAFFLRKKLFEMKYGVELIIVKLNKTQTEWIRE